MSALNVPVSVCTSLILVIQQRRIAGKILEPFQNSSEVLFLCAHLPESHGNVILS